MSLRLHKLNLSQFRNYETLRLSPAGAGIVVLTGRNGAGKTNLLEAVSLLAPGKGLRGAELPEMQNAKSAEPWAISTEIETPQGIVLRLGTGPKADDKGTRRVVRLNGRDMKSQTELGSIVSCVWLTPQMDRLFLEGASQRRRFLDRLVFAFAPDHAFHVNRAEKNMRERLRLLVQERETKKRADPAWLATLETQMAADFSAIAAARLHMTEILNAHLEHLGGTSLFPRPLLGVEGEIEKKCAGRPSVALEEELKEILSDARPLDAAAGRTLNGTHRSDLAARYIAKDMPAAKCSTGEQKGMLTAVILAHALMMKAEKGHPPLILLDEVAAHLDAARQEQLFTLLSAAGGQVWLTGTEENIFEPLKNTARFFAIEDGHAAASLLPLGEGGARALRAGG